MTDSAPDVLVLVDIAPVRPEALRLALHVADGARAETRITCPCCGTVRRYPRGDARLTITCATCHRTGNTADRLPFG